MRPTIRVWILLVLLAAVAPLLLLAGWSVASAGARAEADAREAALDMSELVASQTRQFLADTRQMLIGLAQRPAVRALDPAACDPFLDDWAASLPAYEHLVIVDRDLTPVCSEQDPALDRAALRTAIDQDHLWVGDYFEHATQPLVMVAYPLRNDAGAVSGAVGLPIRLAHFQDSFSTVSLPSQAVISITDAQGRLIGRSQAASSMLGQPAIQPSDLPADVSGTHVSTWSDGVERAYGFIHLPDSGWLVRAGTPTSAIASVGRELLAERLLSGALIIGLTLGFALWVARRIERPVRALAAASRGLAAGALDVRAPLGGPSEVREVAEAFNLMAGLRQRHETELRASRDQLRQVLANAPLALWTFDAEGRLEMLEGSALEQLGMLSGAQPGDEVIGRLGAFAALAEQHRRVLAGETFSAQHLVRGREFEIRFVSRRDSDGNLAGGLALGLDVTKRQQAARAAQASEERFRAFMRHSPLLSFIKDHDGRYLYANPPFAALLGLDPDAIVGRTLTELLPADSARVLLEAEAAALSDNGVAVRRVEVALAGAPRTFELVVFPIRTDSDQLLGGTLADVSEQVETLAALEAERARFVGMFTAASTALLFVDPDDGRITQANPAFSEWLGYAPGEVSDLRDITHPDDLDVDLSEFEEVDRGQRAYYRVEKRYRHRDGHWVWGRLSPFMVRDTAGEVLTSVLMLEDIHERRTAEEEKRVWRDRLEALFARSATAIIFIDAQHDGRVLNTNPAFGQWLGYAPGEVSSLRAITHPDDVDIDLTEFEQLEGRAIGHYSVEKRYRHRDGHWVWGELSAFTVDNDDGTPNMSVIMLDDVSARRVAEEQLRFQAYLLDQVRNAVVATDLDGRITYWNQYAAEVYGWSADEVLGHNAAEFLPIADHDSAGIAERIHRGEAWTGEIMSRRKDGTGFTAFVISAPVVDAEGHSTGVVAISSDISERKRAEAELSHSQRRFEAMFGAAGIGIALVDPSGTVIDANAALAKLLGGEPGTLDDLRAVTDPADLDIDQRQFEQLIAGSIDHYTVDKRYRRADGSRLWGTLTASIVRDESGEPVLAILMLEDTTARRQAQQRLVESEERFRAFMERTPLSAFIKDAEGRYVYANAEWGRITGRESAGLLGAGDHDVFERGIAASFTGDDERARDEGSLQVSQLLSIDDEERILIMTRFRIGDGPAALIGGVALDVTERDRVERERILLAEAMEQAAEGVLVADPDGRVRFANAALGRLVGHEPQELIGRSVREASPQLVTQLLSARDAIESGASWSGELDLQVDGGTIVAEVLVSPVRGPNGRVMAHIAIVRDVTRERALGDQLRQSQKMEAMGRLAGGVAHDFNNLLTVIRGYTELLVTELDGASEAQTWLTQIGEAADRAGDLTSQLLTFSRHRPVAVQLIDPNQLVLDVEPMLRRLIGEDIEFYVRTCACGGRVSADPGQLGQVLMNLVVNARDAMSDGGRLEIAITDAPGSPEWIAISVSDSGSGIEPEVRSRLFDPFFTTKPAGQGTGLGLPIVYGIVTAAGGRVEVDSTPGAGSTFRVLLPLVNQASATEDVPPAEETRNHSGSELVLVSEDDKALRALASRSLRGAGYRVLTAADGESALAQLAKHPDVDLLVTDVVMPGMSGAELGRRATQARPDLPVLFVSGYTEETLIHHGVRAGETAFLQKPFRPSALLAQVRALLDAVTVEG